MVPASRRRPARERELPTFVLIAVIHGGYLALTWWWSEVPLLVGAPLAAWLIAWHGSLQHEAVHGHPTGRRRLDSLLCGAPLSLWIPLAVYRETHLAHHRTPRLTDPLADPESYYVDAAAWQRMSRPRRALHHALQTLAGRMLLGPAVVVARFLAGEARLLVRGERGRRAVWARHALACAAVLAWVLVVCGISPLTYLAAFVYPGLALTLLRSFHEHRPAADQASRSAIVEAGPLLSLLFLHNNLHALHHAEPRLPWYRLPAVYRARRGELLARNRGFLLAGYGEVARRFALRPRDVPYLVSAPPPAPGARAAAQRRPRVAA